MIGTLPISSFQESATHSTGGCQNRTTCCLELLYIFFAVRFHHMFYRTISFPNLDTEKCNVQVGNQFEVLTFSAFFHSMSLNIVMRMIWYLKFSCFVFLLTKTIWISFRKVNVVNHWKLSTGIQFFPHQDPLRLGTRDILRVSSICPPVHFGSVAHGFCSICRHIELSVRRHKLFPSPTWSRSRRTALFSSMSVNDSPGFSHSEFHQNDHESICWVMLNIPSFFGLLDFHQCTYLATWKECCANRKLSKLLTQPLENLTRVLMYRIGYVVFFISVEDAAQVSLSSWNRNTFSLHLLFVFDPPVPVASLFARNSRRLDRECLIFEFESSGTSWQVALAKSCLSSAFTKLTRYRKLREEIS